MAFPAYLQGMETGQGLLDVTYDFSFPAYLQGMETGWRYIDHGGPEWHVPSLPTRDGNGAAQCLRAQHRPVPSLPTRDGNCTGGKPEQGWHQRSQPTYKGWKLGRAFLM